MIDGAGARERDEPQAAAAQAGDRLELGLGVGEAGEDRVSVADELRPASVRCTPAGGALHELRAGLALEGGDLL